MKESMKEILRRHGLLIVSGGVVILLHMLVGVLLWDRLPDPMATHFDIHNQPNGYTGKIFAVFGIPLVLLALYAVCILTGGAPLSKAKPYSDKMLCVLLLIFPAASLLVTALCYGYALGAPFAIDRIVWVFVGAVFVLVGNYLPKMRRNATIGIRVPWTLADDENWNRTHRFAAPIWVAGGILTVVCGVIGAGPTLPIIATAAVVLAPVAYSFWLSMKK